MLEFPSYREVHMVLCALLLGHHVVPGAGLASSSFLAVRGTLAEFEVRSNHRSLTAFREESSAADCASLKDLRPSSAGFSLTG